MRFRLDRRLEWLQYTEMDGGDYDEPDTSHVSQGKIWANMEEETGREAVRGDRVDGSASVIVRLRYNTGKEISARDRFVNPYGETLHITGPPREIGRREGFEFTCTKRSDGGNFS